ncbi:MAG TPA: chromate efflux transporter [Acidobacteriota bacterium]|nr:chromate efflux transporter [Acidobacteriota bacterium]HQO20468.1 chromate efflux transporter [Acidobacteriota bacterium]HQQ47095.1 chromate efflux transporter [Acidobacteriota bacterium]
MEEKKPSLFSMALNFFKIGLTSWGGPAIIAQIKKETVDKKKWVTEGEFKESLGFCQMLPGAIAVQTSAHLGYRLGGTLGSVAAFVAYTIPTVVFMFVLSFLYFRYESVPSFIKLFDGLGIVVVAIIADAILSMRRVAISNMRGLVLAFLAAAAFLLKAPPVAVLLCSCLIGVIIFDKRAQRDELNRIKTSVFLKRLYGPLLFAAVIFTALIIAGAYSPGLRDLGLSMTKVNLLAFGGGYTAVAVMYQESVLRTGWLTMKEFVNGLAMGQITPGPVIITATFIGYKVGGFWGASVATLFVLLPSYLILVFLSPFFNELRSLPFVGRMTQGLLSAFMGMLFQLLIHLSGESLTQWWTLLLLAVYFTLLRLKVSPIFLVAASLVISALMN